MDDIDPLEAFTLDLDDQEYANSLPVEEKDKMILEESISLTSSV